MQRRFTFLMLLALIVFGLALRAEAQFSIRAASSEAVPGWDRMDFEGQAVWVSPNVSLTSLDIERAEESTVPGAGLAVKVYFSDAGAQKMRALSSVQKEKLIAMILDGKVIFAPRVRAEISKDAVITGKAPAGLPRDDAQRILAGLRRR
jgi:preprotein translocase subunit SecD